MQTCEACGRSVSKTVIHVTPAGRTLSICDSCAKVNGFCWSCTSGNSCEFNDNPDPTPKQIVVTDKIGNSVMQTMKQNPDRVKKFCESCNCFFGGECCRQQKEFTCSHYSSVFEKIAEEKDKNKRN